VTNVTVARPSAPERSFPSLLQILAVVATATILAAATLLVGEPARVDRLTVENRGRASVTVSVAPASGAGRQLLGTVEPRDRQEVADLVDQGDTWRFTFASAGDDLGSVTVSRARLARDNWTFVIPASVVNGT
jgi:hypothetical protein